MAFLFLDDDSWGATDDGSINAGQLHRIRDNLVAISTERRPLASVEFEKDSYLRLCGAPGPVAFGPMWIYLSPDETWTGIDMRVRYDTIDFPNLDGDNGIDAVRILGTAGDPFNTWDHPPVESSDSRWRTLVDGATGVAVSTVPILSRLAKGWVCVYLWVWSHIDNDDSATQKLSTANVFQMFGGIDYGAAHGLTDPPERVAFLRNAWQTGSQEVAVDHPAQVMHAVDYAGPPNPAHNLIYTQPPLQRGSAGLIAQNIVLRTIGVVPVESIQLRGVPKETHLSEIEPALRSKRPLAWYVAQNIATQAERLATTRVRQYGCNGGAAERVTTGNQARMWPIRSDLLTNGLTTSYQIIAKSGIIVDPTDSNGYNAIISVAFRAYMINDAITGGGVRDAYDSQIRLDFRLCSYDAGATPAGGTLNASTADGDNEHLMVAMPPVREYTNNVPQPINMTLSALEAGTLAGGAQPIDDWQYRGVLAFREPVSRQGSDIDQLQHFQIDLDESGIVYPMVLAIEAKLDSAIVSSTTIASISYAFRSRRLARRGE